MECLDGGQCVRCSPGYFFDNRIKGSCIRCREGCSECDINKKCKKCFEHYDMDGGLCKYSPFWKHWFFWVVLCYCLVFLFGAIAWWTLKFMKLRKPPRRNRTGYRDSRYELSEYDGRGSVYDRRSRYQSGYRNSRYGDTGYRNSRVQRTIVREPVRPVTSTSYVNRPL